MTILLRKPYCEKTNVGRLPYSAIQPWHFPQLEKVFAQRGRHFFSVTLKKKMYFCIEI